MKQLRGLYVQTFFTFQTALVLVKLLPDLKTGFQYTAVCHKNGVHSKRTHNKFRICCVFFWRPLTLWGPYQYH